MCDYSIRCDGVRVFMSNIGEIKGVFMIDVQGDGLREWILESFDTVHKVVGSGLDHEGVVDDIRVRVFNRLKEEGPGLGFRYRDTVERVFLACHDILMDGVIDERVGGDEVPDGNEVGFINRWILKCVAAMMVALQRPYDDDLLKKIAADNIVFRVQGNRCCGPRVHHLDELVHRVIVWQVVS